MKKFWLSWYCKHEDMGKFELASPWWISGESDTAFSVCAAFAVDSEKEAYETVFKCYDSRPSEIEFRFCKEQHTDWSPFTDRFPRGEWMVWPEGE